MALPGVHPTNLHPSRKLHPLRRVEAACCQGETCEMTMLGHTHTPETRAKMSASHAASPKKRAQRGVAGHRTISPQGVGQVEGGYKQIAVRMLPETLKLIDAIAARADVSFSEQVRVLLDEALTARKALSK